jgi:hypothetical protein
MLRTQEPARHVLLSLVASDPIRGAGNVVGVDRDGKGAAYWGFARGALGRSMRKESLLLWTRASRCLKRGQR